MLSKTVEARPATFSTAVLGTAEAANSDVPFLGRAFTFDCNLPAALPDQNNNNNNNTFINHLITKAKGKGGIKDCASDIYQLIWLVEDPYNQKRPNLISWNQPTTNRISRIIELNRASWCNISRA
jgi:hypothetical protein